MFFRRNGMTAEAVSPPLAFFPPSPPFPPLLARFSPATAWQPETSPIGLSKKARRAFTAATPGFGVKPGHA